MATSPVTNRRKPSADIISPLFRLFIAPPSGEGWKSEYESDLYEPTRLIESDGGEYSTLEYRVVLGADPRIEGTDDQVRVETSKFIQSGSRIRLVDAAKDPPEEWFVGYSAQDYMIIQGSPQEERRTFTAYGPEWLLDKNVVTGKWFASNAADSAILGGALAKGDRYRSAVVQTDIPCVFNANSLPDMSGLGWALPTQYGGNDANVFTPGDRKSESEWLESKTWTAYKALRSTIEWFDDYEVISKNQTDWTAIKKLLDGITIGEVSIDGLPLLSAVRAILGPLGFGFRLAGKSDGSFKHKLEVYDRRADRVGQNPYLPPVGSDATDEKGSRGELSSIRFLRDAHNLRNVVTVCGQPEMVQTELRYYTWMFDLKDMAPAWDIEKHPIPVDSDGKFNVTQLEDAEAFGNKYHSTGSNFPENQNVWRKFIFNEDGGASGIALPDLPSFGLGRHHLSAR